MAHLLKLLVLMAALLFQTSSLLAQSMTNESKLSPKLPSGFQAKSFSTSDQVKLSYYEAAPKAPSQSTLVFVPGWSMPGWIWFNVAKQWSATHRVIVFDPRGQGQSEVAPTGYEYKRRAADIAELIAACQCSQVTLIGWSLGGLEAVQYTQIYNADHLAGLVLVDHSVGVGKPPSWDPTFFNRLRTDHPKAMAMFVRSMFTQKPSPVALRQLTEAALHLPLQPAIELLSQPVPREFWRDAVVNAPVPVLYLVIPKFAEQAQIIKELKLQNSVPNANRIHVRVFEGLGHALFVDDAVSFNAEISEFLKRNLLVTKP